MSWRLGKQTNTEDILDPLLEKNTNTNENKSTNNNKQTLTFQGDIKVLSEPSFIVESMILYTNIDLKLCNKLHGTMHYKIGVACVFNGHVFYTLLYITIILFTYFVMQWSMQFSQQCQVNVLMPYQLFSITTTRRYRTKPQINVMHLSNIHCGYR